MLRRWQRCILIPIKIEVEDRRDRDIGQARCIPTEAEELTDRTQRVMMLNQSQGVNLSFLEGQLVTWTTKQQPTGDVRRSHPSQPTEELEL
jgi:hypothetical protein